MTRSGPARLPSVLQLDGRRYSVESLPDEIKTLIIDLQKADAVLQNRSRTVQVLKTAQKDLRTKLQQALQQQDLSPDQAIQAPVAPMPEEVPVDEPRASEEQGGESPRPGTVRRAKDKVKGLLRRFMGGNQS